MQFLQHELRDDERAVDEAGLADVRDAPVDDHAGIEDLVSPRRPGGTEQADQARRFQPFTVLGPNHETEVREHDQDEAVEKRDTPVACVRKEQTRANGPRQEQPNRAADERTQDVRHRRFAEPALEEHDEGGQHQGEADVHGNAQRKRPEQGRRVRHRGDKQDARESKPGHGAPSSRKPPRI